MIFFGHDSCVHDLPGSIELKYFNLTSYGSDRGELSHVRGKSPHVRVRRQYGVM